MRIIGLTGSIATGKSSVSDMFRYLRIPVHDADRSVHNFLGPHGLAVSDIIAAFGDVGNLDNGIDRQKLGDIIFSDPEAKNRLELIVHPLIWQDRQKFFKHMRLQNRKIVVVDIPLLFETGSDMVCDNIICVWAPYFLQRQRALHRAGMTQQKLDTILNNQLPQHTKMQLADFCLPTGLGKAYTYKLLKRWLLSN
ncbi:dephospho-CoA kinase, partial [Alphaproteobacteria bacterium]|nr:dephospho-CoA kinase [Alphaproteobacteria bacterium]